MSIDTGGKVLEFSFNTAYFTVTAEQLYFFADTEEQISAWKSSLPEIIKDELTKLGGGIIWWRIKPESEQISRGKRKNKYRGYVRFATSPDLPQDVMTRLGLNLEMYTEMQAQEVV